MRIRKQAQPLYTSFIFMHMKYEIQWAGRKQHFHGKDQE